MVILGYYIKEEGCGDNSCLVKKPKGMATNGGCICTKHVKREDVLHVKRGIEDLLELRKNNLTNGDADGKPRHT
jgi:hypothetical protein